MYRGKWGDSQLLVQTNTLRVLLRCAAILQKLVRRTCICVNHQFCALRYARVQTHTQLSYYAGHIKAYKSLRKDFGLPSLRARRKLLTSPLLEFRLPGNTRSQDIFSRRAMPTLYSHHSCIPHLGREGNEVSGEVDFFSTTPSAFKKCLRQIIFPPQT
ncbi:hypothetical protein J6590_072562 [Homalodisca vitripennis]|nr:hypothetical protein J6590_072562 [Homalodisca vitripennis]